MCGINGVFSLKYSKEQKSSMICAMNTTLAHRGPDNAGLWSAEEISLGHRRLSIIDLSEESNQPFVSSDGRYVIVYNGELYNYRELKLELQRAAKGSVHQAYIFRTGSDTEVVLAAFVRYGYKCLEYFNGMFAFAIYDTEQKKLFIARDRMGVKPLYYSYGEEGLIFSSELRSILHSGFKKFKLNKEVLSEYTLYQTVMAPNTIIKGIRFLEAGHYMVVTAEAAEMVQYYNLNQALKEKEVLTYSEICLKVRDLLTHSVQRRLISDVPIGAFLSGGIDSSCVVGLMSELSSSRINTFNVSFDEGEFSESKYAKQIAQKFNTVHHEIRLQPTDFLNQLPAALKAMDHPSGDGPNTYVVSKATKAQGITVALSGIGGDEVFAGYDVFKRMKQLQKKAWLNAFPLFIRKAGAGALRMQKPSVANYKMAELLEKNKIDFKHAYPLSRSLFTESQLALLIEPKDAYSSIKKVMAELPWQNQKLLSAVSIAEINTYLQHTLLRDTDQMSMAHALEVREPFLDHQLVEFVLGLDDEHKFPHTPKKLLVDSLSHLLPEEIVNRKKMGFVLPWQEWLKKDLYEFCEAQVKGMESRSLFKEGAIAKLWQDFLNGHPMVNWSRIWHLIVLNHWLDMHKVES
ncbi:MAG: asparagine synthase (glutamine-hydrolyzing) [Bacteroidia bacterium]|nr:asparagine synthase (glutamine-hydrolyzing) [Bacteroidia bacterium]